MAKDNKAKILLAVCLVVAVVVVLIIVTKWERLEKTISETPAYSVGHITDNYLRRGSLASGSVPTIEYEFQTDDGTIVKGKSPAKQYADKSVGDTITIVYNIDKTSKNRPAYLDWNNKN